jgi:hypothetical protein
LSTPIGFDRFVFANVVTTMVAVVVTDVDWSVLLYWVVSKFVDSLKRFNFSGLTEFNLGEVDEINLVKL